MLKVYAVIEGYDYEGEDFTTLKLFSSEEAANAYKDELLSAEFHGDYVIVEEREIL
jgi:hypothetical protein